jgi:hypothetical protein
MDIYPWEEYINLSGDVPDLLYTWLFAEEFFQSPI